MTSTCEIGASNMNLEMTIFQLITHSGDAKSSLFEAIHFAKEGNFKEAEAKIEAAESQLAMAHKIQTGLIQTEAQGEKTEVSLLLIHAQDHLMNAIMFKDLTKELIELYSRTAV